MRLDERQRLRVQTEDVQPQMNSKESSGLLQSARSGWGPDSRPQSVNGPPRRRSTCEILPPSAWRNRGFDSPNGHKLPSCCSASPFETIEAMLNHVTSHPEWVTVNIAPKEGNWVVLVEPHERYRRKNRRGERKYVPRILQGLPTIKRQMKKLGIE